MAAWVVQEAGLPIHIDSFRFDEPSLSARGMYEVALARAGFDERTPTWLEQLNSGEKSLVSGWMHDLPLFPLNHNGRFAVILDERTAAAIALGFVRNEKMASVIDEALIQNLEKLLTEKMAHMNGPVRTIRVEENQTSYRSNPDEAFLRALILSLARRKCSKAYSFLEDYFNSIARFELNPTNYLLAKAGDPTTLLLPLNPNYQHSPDQDLLLGALYEINPQRTFTVLLNKLEELTTNLLRADYDDPAYWASMYLDSKLWSAALRFFSMEDYKRLESSLERVKYKTHSNFQFGTDPAEPE